MMYICITFDYELFFGNNIGTYDEVLFQPTYALIDALEKMEIPATFFADVCSIPVAKKYHQDEYVVGFQKQIQYMKQHGQDVQLHLHPHWYNSVWEGGRWNFSSSGYRLHEFGESGEINQIIIDGIEYLKKTIFPVDPNYECIAYRAGGFSIQPHEKLITALYDCGIRVDSSVAPHLYTKSEANFYDYRHEIEKLNGCISDKTEWWKDNKAGKNLFEIPIATVDKSPIAFLIRRILAPNTIKISLGPKRGSYITVHHQKESKISSYYKYLKGYNALSMDAYAAKYLYTQTRRFYKKEESDDCVIAIIGHPKLVTDAYIENLMEYINRIKRDSRFEFISIYDAYRLKENNNGT